MSSLIGALADRGVTSIEIRSIGPSIAPSDALKYARIVWDKGLSVTIHGQVRSAESAVEDVFAPLSEILGELTGHQPLLTVTVHPVKGPDPTAATLDMMNALCDHILENDLPVRIALENNRRMPDNTIGDSVALVTYVMKAVRARLDADPRVFPTHRSGGNCVAGICFDMGHYAWWWEQVHQGEAYVPPCKDFLKYVIHTHIHAVSPAGQTHFPLTEDNRLPLAENLRALTRHLNGVLNLELSFERFSTIMPPDEALRVSLDALDVQTGIRMRALYDVRMHYVERMTSAGALLRDAPENGTRFALVQSTFYVFDTNGTKWVMDPVLREAASRTDAPDHIAACLSGAEYILITHEHDDHLEEFAVRRLAGRGFQWVVPDWLIGMAKSFGLTDAEIIPAHVGESLTLGAMTVLPFEGRHFRSHSSNGVKNMGYRVTSPGSPTLLFPGDVRDYDPAGFAGVGPADVVFAHVWLGDGACLNAEYPLADDFVRLMGGFGARKVLLCHLYEAARDERSMWRRCHAELLADRFHALCPDVSVLIPEGGEIIRL
ncbi:MAG: MBL fold metallo-hydrolase [Clostridia bacterium]|nr:MBL fold metallo-hydrolase [Clostridia bacterium]